MTAVMTLMVESRERETETERERERGREREFFFSITKRKKKYEKSLDKKMNNCFLSFKEKLIKYYHF